MLVILNGAPKGGSTWLYRIFESTELFSKIPLQYQDPEWKTVSSISLSMLGDFLQESDYKAANYFSKQHWDDSQPTIDNFLLLENPDVKMFNIIRDIRDVLVSRYFHDVRFKLTEEENIDNYYFGKSKKSRGKNLMKRYMKYQNYWHGNRNSKQPFLCSYEMLHYDFVLQVSKMFDYLNQDSLTAEIDIEMIQQKTTVSNKKNKNQVGEGRLLRKGIIGDWKNYLSAAILKDLKNLAIETGYLETKKHILENFQLDILKTIDFGISS